MGTAMFAGNNCMKPLLYMLVVVAYCTLVAPAPVARAQATTDDKLDALSKKIDDLTKKVESDDDVFTKIVLPLLTALTGIAALIATYKLTKGSWDQARDNAQRGMLQQRAENEAKVIRDKLDTFFGPLIQLMATTTILYEALRSAQPDPDNFRALRVVLEGPELDPNSQRLLEEIIELGKTTETLISEKAGLIDEDIQAVLWRLQAHYRVLRLAHDGALSGEFKRFEQYVFPREVHKLVDEKASNLKKRMKWLLSVENPVEDLFQAG